MKNKIGQYGLNTFYSIVSIVTFYYMCCLVLPLIHVNNDYLKKNKGTAIYITNIAGKSNIIVPLKNKITNWEEHFSLIKFDSIQPNQKWLCFGFDEEDAYLENDSSFLSYLFLLPQYCGFGQSIIHVNYFYLKQYELKLIFIPPMTSTSISIKDSILIFHGNSMIKIGVLRNSRLRSCFNARSTRLYFFIKKKSVTKMMYDLNISNHFKYSSIISSMFLR